MLGLVEDHAVLRKANNDSKWQLLRPTFEKQAQFKAAKRAQNGARGSGGGLGGGSGGSAEISKDALARPALFASRSVRRALLTPQVNPGSLYRCRRST